MESEDFLARASEGFLAMASEGFLAMASEGFLAMASEGFLARASWGLLAMASERSLTKKANPWLLLRHWQQTRGKNESGWSKRFNIP